MTNWTIKRLSEISYSCLGKMLDKDKNKGEYQPYLANLNVQWGEFRLSSLKVMRFEEHEKDRYGLKYGDLIICEGGEPWRCGIWRDELPNMKVQKALHRLRVLDGYSSDFLFYRMLLAGKNQELHRHFIGSTIKHLTGIGLKNIEFEFPSIGEQETIASALRSLDKKIQLNNKLNTELEAIAKLIYDYWFVQFDFPDANGKPYKSSGGKMVYNEELKRHIPEGWEVHSISEKLTIGSGYSFSSDSYLSAGKYKVITIKNVQDHGLQTKKVDFVENIPSNLDAFCILETRDILISLTGNVGRVCLVNEENLLLNQRVGKFLCNQKYKNYLYFTYLRPEFRTWLEQIATGGGQKNLSPIDAVKKYYVFPSPAILEKFNALTLMNLNLVVKNSFESKELNELRDWLLPMLMNGQVTIKES